MISCSTRFRSVVELAIWKIIKSTTFIPGLAAYFFLVMSRIFLLVDTTWNWKEGWLELAYFKCVVSLKEHIAYELLSSHDYRIFFGKFHNIKKKVNVLRQMFLNLGI